MVEKIESSHTAEPLPAYGYILRQASEKMTSQPPTLPDEILVMILDSIDPFEGKNLVLASRHFSGLWNPLVPGKLRALYGHYKMETYGDATRLFENMLRYPSVIPNIEELTIHKIVGWQDIDEEEPDIPPSSERRLAIFRTAVERSSLVQAGSIDSHMTDIAAGEEELILALIFCALTHLKTLHFVQANISEDRVNDIDPLTVVLKNLDRHARSGALSKLGTVYLGGSSWEYRASFPPTVRWLAYFAALPSVETIHAYGVDDDDSTNLQKESEEVEIEPKELIFFRALRSNVKTLSLQTCSIDSEILGILLGGFDELETLKVDGFQIGPDLMMTGLAAGADVSLKTLHLSRPTLDRARYPLTEGLEAFEVIKEVQVDHRLISAGSWFETLRRNGSIESFTLLCRNLQALSEIDDFLNCMADVKGRITRHIKVFGVTMETRQDDVWLVGTVEARCRQLGLDFVPLIEDEEKGFWDGQRYLLA